MAGEDTTHLEGSISKLGMRIWYLKGGGNKLGEVVGSMTVRRTVRKICAAERKVEEDPEKRSQDISCATHSEEPKQRSRRGSRRLSHRQAIESESAKFDLIKLL